MGDAATLRGRDAQLAQLARLLHEPALPGAVVLGTAGIGKSALVAALCDQARERGWDVRLGVAAPLDAALPFAPLAAALDLSPQADDPRTAAVGRALRGGDAHDAAPGQLRWRVVDGVVDLLDAASRERPVLLVLEDVHWADGDTLSAVARCWRAARQLDVAVVVTSRPVDPSTPAAGLTADPARHGCLQVELAELAEPDLVALATDVLGGPPGPQLRTLLSKTGGNPFYAQEVLHDLRRQGAVQPTGNGWESAAQVLPPAASSAVARHLEQVGPTVRELLVQAAVLGSRFRPEELALTRQQSAGAVWAALAPALEAGLLFVDSAGLRFRHDLVREALYESLPAQVRESLHVDVARALDRAGLPAERVGAHLAVGARSGPDAERLVELAEAVVDRAPDVASGWAAQATAVLPPSAPARVRARLLEARASALGERPERAVALARSLLAETLPPDVAAELWATIAQAEAYLGVSSDETAEQLVRVVRELRGQHPRLQRLSALTARALRAAGRGEEAGALAESVVHSGSGDVGAQCLALGVLGRQALDRGDAEQAFALVDRSLELARTAGTLLEWTGIEAVKDFSWVRGIDVSDDRLVEVCEHILVEGERLGLRAALPIVSAELAETLRFRGRCPEAEAYALAALDELGGSGHASAEADAWFTVLLVAARRGDAEPFDRAPPALARAQSAANVGPLGLAHAWALAHSGNEDVAWVTAEQARRWYEQHSPDFMYVWSHPYVRLAVDRGELALGASFTALIEAAAARMGDHPILLAQARMAQALLARDVDLAREAVALSRLGPVLPNQLDALVVAGEISAANGSRDEAVQHLDEARRIAKQADATVDLARIDAALRSVGVIARRSRSRPATGWEALTEVERRVAEAVADGLTYRQVGQRLYVSPRTVETHAASIFRKVGVRSRHEFGAAWHRHRETAS